MKNLFPLKGKQLHDLSFMKIRGVMSIGHVKLEPFQYVLSRNCHIYGIINNVMDRGGGLCQNRTIVVK